MKILVCGSKGFIWERKREGNQGRKLGWVVRALKKKKREGQLY